MAQYDGSIRINTQINTQNASAQLMYLENRIVRTTDRIASLRSRMDALRDVEIPTQEYRAIESDIARANRELDRLLERQAQMQREGRNSGAAWENLNQRIQASRDYIEQAESELQELVDSGRAFTLGSNTQEYENLSRQSQYAENELSVLLRRHEELSERQNDNSERYKQLGRIAKASFNSIGTALKKANALINGFGKRIKQAFSNLTKSTDSSNRNALTTGKILKRILKYVFVIDKIMTGIKEGFSNFVDYSSKFKSSIDSIKGSALTLKNSFASAFAPLVEIAIPYIQRVIDYLVKLLNVVGQVIAAITGQKTYTKAIKQTTAAIEEQNKAQNKQVSNLDKLNNLSSGSGGGTGGGAADMFEEVPIEDRWKDTADKIKKIGKDFFKPLKKAWDKEGKFVMKAWKYALDEIKKLTKDIGRDFLEVWQQDKTVAMFEDILHIVGDIGLVVGNLAKNFREAWNTNKVGLHIFENIRDILAVIIHNIRLAADYTVKWSKTIDFYPLLSKIEEWTRSLVPVFDTLSGIVTDFYTKVLLPLGKWTIEKGLPELLQVFIDFNNKVDWETLRSNLAEFWKHLEPFAETVGEGLILFIRDVSDALAGFLNSQQFKDFLKMVEDWMDSVRPEDVANGLKMLAKAIIAIKVALLGYKAIMGVKNGLKIVKNFFAIWVAGSGTAMAGEMTAAAGGLNAFAASLSAFATGAGLALAAGEPLKKMLFELFETPELYEKYKGAGGSFKLIGDSFADMAKTAKAAFNDLTNSTGAFESAMETVNEGVILTDERMQRLSQSTGFCNDDIESLTEGMISLHPELEEVRKEFGLWDVYPETLSNIAQGVKLIKDGTVDAGNAFEEFRKPTWEMTEDALVFFKQVQDGTISVTNAHSSMKEQVVMNNGEISASNDVLEIDLSDHTDEWAADMGTITDEHGNMVLDVTQGSDSLRDTFDSNNAEINTSNDGMAQNFSDNADNITDKVSDIEGSLDENKGGFSSWAESIGNSLKGAWDSAKEWLGKIIDKIGELMGSISSVVGGAFSSGKSVTSYSSPTLYSTMPQMAALSKMEFPGYATGQVIPTSMKKHLAWLGDNSRETEVVSPLSTIKEAVTDAVIELAKTGLFNGNNNGDIVIQIDGREVFRAVQRQARQNSGTGRAGLVI